jgi:putative CGCGG family rSAM target protein
MFARVYTTVRRERTISMTDSICVSDSREPVTRRTHDHPWAADLETERHADDKELVVGEALDAVRQTQAGQHVNLVTHKSHGHPATYLYQRVESLDRSVVIADDGRCSCEGYVTRVFVR